MKVISALNYLLQSIIKEYIISYETKHLHKVTSCVFNTKSIPFMWNHSK